MSRKEIVPLNELATEYPFLNESFVARNNVCVIGEMLSLSGWERIKRLGGVKKVWDNIRLAREAGLGEHELFYTTLKACEQSPTLTDDIAQFTFHATKRQYKPDLSDLLFPITALLTDGVLEGVSGVKLLHLDRRTNLVTVTLDSNRFGYMTNENGSGRLVKIEASFAA